MRQSCTTELKIILFKDRYICRVKWTACLFAFLFLSCHSMTAKTHAFRLKPGADLRKEIQSFVQKNNIEAGWISCGVGSLHQYNIRFANQPNGAKDTGHFEIVSLIGTVSKNGSHIHISVSDTTGKTIGGHLLEENLIYTTAEVIIQEAPGLIFTREKDGSTPWQELQIKER